MITDYLQKLRLFGRDVWLYLGAWFMLGFAYSGIFLVLFNLYLLRLGYGPTMITAAYFVYGQELVSSGWQAVMSGAIWMGSGVGGSFILIAGGRIITTVGYSSFFLTVAALTALGGLLFLGYFHVPRGEIARGSAPEGAD